MELLISILGFTSLAYLIVDLTDTIDKYNSLPQKPFKCSLCMGFWLSVVPNFLMFGWQGILVSAITAVTTETLDRRLNK